MAEDLLFNAKIQLDGADDILKRIEGSLPKVGLAAQKEFDNSVKNSMTGSAGGAAGAVGAIITRTVSALANPLMTAQETRVAAMPQIAGMLMKMIPFVGDKLAPIVQGLVEGGLQKSKFIYSGAREEVSSVAAQMAEMGMPMSKERKRTLLRESAARKERVFEDMEETRGIAQKTFKGRMGNEIEDIIETFEKQLGSLGALLADFVLMFTGISNDFKKAGDGDTLSGVKALSKVMKKIGGSPDYTPDY